MCTLAFDRRYEMDGLIGGPGIIVEIDECKIGRRKLETGRLREGALILDAIISLQNETFFKISANSEHGSRSLFVTSQWSSRDSVPSVVSMITFFQ